MSRQPVRDYSRLAGTAFDRAGVAGLTAMIVGAGALGNEVLKCLALMGVGELVIVDRDRIERSNLTRSVLYCAPGIDAEIEAGTAKAAFAARRVAEINPDVRARFVVGEIADVGLGLVRRVDVVFGCLDNEMARVELGWACLRANRLLVDGGLGNLNASSGMVLVFPGQDGPCPLCRKSAERRRALLWELQGREDPCWMKERGQDEAGMVPTTPVMASMVGALQVELGVRAVLDKAETRGTGRAYRLQLHPGPALDVRMFDRSPSCPLHDPGTFLQEIEERRDRRSASWPVSELLREAGASSLQLDWPLTAGATCRGCGANWTPLVRRARFRQARCPECGGRDLVETDVVSDIGAGSPLASRSLAELGLPAGHVHDLVFEREGGVTHRFIEVTGDLREGGAVLMPLVLGIGVLAVLHGLSLALGLGVLLAPVLALVGFAYWRMVRPDDKGADGHRSVVIMTTAGALAGTIMAAGAGIAGADGWAWTAIPLAALVASAIFSLAFSGGAATCQLCRQPAPVRASFVCPRCHDRVCARPSCWQAKYARCVRCHEREIVILPVVEAWWKPRLGARVKHGECSHCYKEAHEADLRECGQCRWPMCQRCWDYHNGVCQRCKWVIPDLPPTLAAYVAGAAPARARAAAPAAARVSAPASPREAPPGRRPDPRAPQPPGREGAAAGSTPPRRPGRDSSGR